MCASFDTFPHLSRSIKMAFSLCHLNIMYDTTCIVFLKESLRKTHFDSFSAVSAAPEACELANCAEFEAPAIYCTESRRRAQKTWNFRGARSARHKVPHPGTTQNYSKFTTTTRKEREKENLFLYPPPPRSRPKLAHFILYKKRSRLQNLKSIRFDLKKLWSKWILHCFY